MSASLILVSTSRLRAQPSFFEEAHGVIVPFLGRRAFLRVLLVLILVSSTV